MGAIAYGWPRTFHTSGEGGGVEPPVDIKYNSFRTCLAIITASNLFVWSGNHYRTLLGTLSRDAVGIEKDGENKELFWKPESHQLAVVTTKGYVYFYKVNKISQEKLFEISGSISRPAKDTQTTEAAVDKVTIDITCKFLVPGLATCITGDRETVSVGTTVGYVVTMLWTSEVREGISVPSVVDQMQSKEAMKGGSEDEAAAGDGPSGRLDLDVAVDGDAIEQMGQELFGDEEPDDSVLAEKGGKVGVFLHSQVRNSVADGESGGGAANRVQHSMKISQIVYSRDIHLLVCLFEDGRVSLCRFRKRHKGARVAPKTAMWLDLQHSEAGSPTCIAVSSSNEILAIGFENGLTKLYSVAKRGMTMGTFLKSLSLEDMIQNAHPRITGEVNCLSWSPDQSTLSVGWAKRGLAVWTAHGSRCVTTIPSFAGDEVEAASRRKSSQQHQSEDELPQTQQARSSSSVSNTNSMSADQCEVLRFGVKKLDWGPEGYHLQCVQTQDTQHDDERQQQLHHGTSAESLRSSAPAEQQQQQQQQRQQQNSHNDTVVDAANSSSVAANGNNIVSSFPSALTIRTDIVQLSFIRPSVPRNIFTNKASRNLMQGEDKIFSYTVEENLDASRQRLEFSELTPIQVPLSYLHQHFPAKFVSASDDTHHIAVAGRHGVLVHNVRTNTWKFLATAAQELQVACRGLVWVENVLLVFNYDATNFAHQILAFDNSLRSLNISNVLLTKRLSSRAVRVAVSKPHILVFNCNRQLTLYRYEIASALFGSASFKLDKVVRVSWKGQSSNVVAMELLPVDTEPFHTTENARRCLLLHANGDLHLVFLQPCNTYGGEIEGKKQYVTIGKRIETMWMDEGRLWVRGIGGLGVVEATNLTHGSCDPAKRKRLPAGADGGVGVGIGLDGANTDAQAIVQAEDELGGLGRVRYLMPMDTEVLPLAFISEIGIMVGATQGMSMFPKIDVPCFDIRIRPMLYLGPLLLHHLKQPKGGNLTIAIADAHCERPYFFNALEFLLHTCLEEADANKKPTRSPSSPDNQDSLEVPAPSAGIHHLQFLGKSVRFLRRYPEYLDVVVSVARKVDCTMWPTLFAVTGEPRTLFEEAFEKGEEWMRTAAAYLVILKSSSEQQLIANLCGLKLLETVLDLEWWPLAQEIVSYLQRCDTTSSTAANSSRVESSDRLNGGTGTTGIASVKTDIERLLQQRARALLLKRDLRTLYTLSHHIPVFDVDNWLQCERSYSAHVPDLSHALAHAHMHFELPMRQEVEEALLRITPAVVDDLTELKRAVRPRDGQHTDFLVRKAVATASPIATLFGRNKCYEWEMILCMMMGDLDGAKQAVDNSQNQRLKGWYCSLVAR